VTKTSSIERSFFKYASPQTALAILQNKTVRYSTPLEFNDPFDFQSGLHFDFNLNTLHTKILDKLEALITSKEEPLVDANDDWGKIVLLLRENYPTQGFQRTDLEQLVAPSFARMVQLMQATQTDYQEHWKKALPNIRVFCVSEERDNLLMWAHYAKDHTGVAFELRSLPEEDNPLSVAEPVEYVPHPVPFFTETEWIENILSIRKLDWSALYKRYAHIKSTHWQYEHEWRVWYPQKHGADSGYYDCPIRESELVAVYLGCRAEPNFASDVISLTQIAFPNTRIYRAHKSGTDYALEYEKLA